MFEATAGCGEAADDTQCMHPAAQFPAGFGLSKYWKLLRRQASNAGELNGGAIIPYLEI
jgi:hypothetical protein